VRIEGDQIHILDVVYFRTNRAVIRPTSFTLLENVAQVLNAHPEIAKIRVEGHTDSRGRHARNMRLSQQRAEAVVRFLTERGNVDPARLESEGYGPDRPIVAEASSAEEHARNRRVEFHIMGSAEGVEQTHSDPTADTVDR